MDIDSFQVLWYLTILGFGGIGMLCIQCWQQINTIDKLRSYVEMSVYTARGYRDYIYDRGQYKDYKMWKEKGLGALSDLVPWPDPREGEHKPSPELLASIHKAFADADAAIKKQDAEEAEVVLVTPPPIPLTALPPPLPAAMKVT